MSAANKDIGPPVVELGVMGWVRKNLFSNWYNSLLTIFGLYLLYILIPPLVNWIFLDANFVGMTRDDCTNEGACWIFIQQNLKLIFYGLYPTEELWRINFVYLILFVSGVYPVSYTHLRAHET